MIFDPRDGFHKETDNPALIAGDLFLHNIASELQSPNLMIEIAKMADFCDELIPVPPELL